MRSSTRFTVATQLLGLAVALPNNVAVPRQELQAAKDTYDYVIVGGGITGLIVANRITEDKKSESIL
jgi:BarA-like signal transduction histidine kinase